MHQGPRWACPTVSSIAVNSPATNPYGNIEVGSQTGGYRVEIDTKTAAVHVVAWGFWDAEVASQFGKDAAEACRQNPRTRELTMDMGGLKPMRDEGQRGFGELIRALPKLGIESVTIATASHLTKLQLLRIVKSNDQTGRVRFVEAGAGSGWTR